MPLADPASGRAVVPSVGTGPTVSPERPGHPLAPGGVSPQHAGPHPLGNGG